MPAPGQLYRDKLCGCEFRLARHDWGEHWVSIPEKCCASGCNTLVGRPVTILVSNSYTLVSETTAPAPAPAAGELWRLECGCVVRLDEPPNTGGLWECTEVIDCGSAGPGVRWTQVGQEELAAATLWDDGVGLPQPRVEDDGDSYTTEYVTKPPESPASPAPAAVLPERQERAYGVCYQCPNDAAWYTRSRVPLCQTCARLLQEETTHV